MFPIKRKKGFSLVELIITVAVLGIVMAGVTAFTVRMSNAAAEQRRKQAQHINEEQARMALLQIVRDARLSHQIVSAGSGVLKLRALHPTTGDLVDIDYEIVLDGSAATDVFTGSHILTRTVTGVPAGHEWPNPFSSVTIKDGNAFQISAPVELDRLTINITVMKDQTDDSLGDTTYTSEVSVQRRPAPLP